jgi:hypothetical protein
MINIYRIVSVLKICKHFLILFVLFFLGTLRGFGGKCYRVKMNSLGIRHLHTVIPELRSVICGRLEKRERKKGGILQIPFGLCSPKRPKRKKKGEAGNINFLLPHMYEPVYPL